MILDYGSDSNSNSCFDFYFDTDSDYFSTMVLGLVLEYGSESNFDSEFISNYPFYYGSEPTYSDVIFSFTMVLMLILVPDSDSDAHCSSLLWF